MERARSVFGSCRFVRVLGASVALVLASATLADSPESKPLAPAAKQKTEAAPLGNSEPSISASTVQTVVSLAGVVALIVVLGVTVRLVSRRSGGLMAALGAGGRAPSGILEVLGRYPVGRGSTLILLKMDRRVLLLCQGRGGKLGGTTMTTLTEVTDAEDVASILLKVRDEEGDTLARKFQGMLSASDRAAAAALEEPAGVEITDEPTASAIASTARPHATQRQPSAIRSRLQTMRTPAAGGGAMRLRTLAVALATAAFALAAPAQVGPPVDAAPASVQPVTNPTVNPPAGPLLSLPTTTATDALNPLQMIDSAARVLPGGNTSSSDGEKPGLSTALNILVVLTVVALAPSIMLMCTCFVRILIVLGLLRQAMGTQSVPPPQVTTALALFMTLLVMAPTLDRINAEAIVPYRQGEIKDYDELWNKAKQPLRDFMFNQIEATGNWSSLYMILEYRGVDTSEPEKLSRADVDMISLVPAYMLSELKTAFLMGFRIYLPFLVIDMVISTMLIAMSMMMLPPVLISLPFKLLLFVLVDGWTLVVGGLMHSFAQTGSG
ncbi:MAG TPA: flagellar type III secretion system pore protein FliP [Phycisphaerales bacterium]|nr:flagellar type III secretion system pore protein FliP [Phycisphaerales bacterium]